MQALSERSGHEPIITFVRPFLLRRRTKGKARGSFLLDVMLSVFVISLAAAAFFTLFPTFKRSERLSQEESKASLMAQRMIEHLQLLKPKDINASTLSQLNLIDAGQTQAPYSFSHIPLDEGSMYSPNQVLRNAVATMSVDDLSVNSKRIVLFMSWTSASGKTRSITTGTILGGYR